jgi:hypothetical protein
MNYKGAGRVRFLGVTLWEEGSDLAEAHELAEYVVGPNEETARHFLARLRADARAILDRQWNSVEAIAEALLERRTLSENEIAAVIQRALTLAQTAHGVSSAARAGSSPADARMTGYTVCPAAGA